MAEVIDDKAMRKLTDLGHKVPSAIERRAMRRGAKIVLQRAKQTVPIGDDNDYDTKDGKKAGDLRRSLKIRTLPSRQGVFRISVASTLPYAKVIEYGHRKNTRTGRKMFRKPDFFLWGALKEMEQQVRQEIQDAIREELFRLN